MKATAKNIKVNTAYGVSGVEVKLNLQELFQLSMKADILGQLVGQQTDIPEFARCQLRDLGNFLDHILRSAGFEKAGRADIFAPVPADNEEEDE